MWVTVVLAATDVYQHRTKHQRDCVCPVLVSLLSTTVTVCDEAEVVLGELLLPSTSS